MMKLEENGLKLKEEVDTQALYEEYCQMEAEGYFDKNCGDDYDIPEGKNMAFQVMMRDTHGTIETDTWGVVSNAGTFDKKGLPIKGGMYDHDIFGLRDMDKSWQKALKVYKPEKIVGRMGIMVLALPVCDPYCPRGLNPDKWVHLTAIPVPPMCFRAMDCDGEWVDDEAKLWNELAELNFAIPKLLEENPERKAELQEKLQDAVNAVFTLYKQLPVPEDEWEMHCFLYHAMLPIEIEEDYDAVLSIIKTIKATAELMKNVFDAEDQLVWVRNLCLICNVVGYDSDEVEEYFTWAQEALDGIDAWMKGEDE